MGHHRTAMQFQRSTHRRIRALHPPTNEIKLFQLKRSLPAVFISVPSKTPAQPAGWHKANRQTPNEQRTQTEQDIPRGSRKRLLIVWSIYTNKGFSWRTVVDWWRRDADSTSRMMTMGLRLRQCNRPNGQTYRNTCVEDAGLHARTAHPAL